MTYEAIDAPVSESTANRETFHDVKEKPSVMKVFESAKGAYRKIVDGLKRTVPQEDIQAITEMNEQVNELKELEATIQVKLAQEREARITAITRALGKVGGDASKLSAEERKSLGIFLEEDIRREEEESASQYLKNRLQVFDEESERLQQQKEKFLELVTPERDIEYGREGEGAFTVDGLDVSFAYSSPETLPPEIRRWVAAKIISNESGVVSIQKLMGLTTEPDNYRQLDDLHITDPVTGEAKSLADIIPDGQKVFFRPKKLDPENPLEGDTVGNNIVITGNMESFATILTLLHESGHLHKNKDHSYYTEEGEARIRYNTDQVISRNDGAVVMRSERDAWAYALNKIKPFITKERKLLTNDTLRVASHLYSTDNYGKSIKRKIPELAAV